MLLLSVSGTSVMQWNVPRCYDQRETQKCHRIFLLLIVEIQSLRNSSAQALHRRRKYRVPLTTVILSPLFQVRTRTKASDPSSDRCLTENVRCRLKEQIHSQPKLNDRLITNVHSVVPCKKILRETKASSYLSSQCRCRCSLYPI